MERKTDETPEQELIRKLNENELVRKIMELPVRYREVIVLYYFEQQKSKEIAELLDLKESTVRMRIKRGIDKLKQELIGEEVHRYHG